MNQLNSIHNKCFDGTFDRLSKEIHRKRKETNQIKLFLSTQI